MENFLQTVQLRQVRGKLFKLTIETVGDVIICRGPR
jgi:hypothetical protein